MLFRFLKFVSAGRFHLGDKFINVMFVMVDFKVTTSTLYLDIVNIMTKCVSALNFNDHYYKEVTNDFESLGTIAQINPIACEVNFSDSQ